ncbi:MAG TPA: hypothetical protein VHP30_00285, partial [Ignavibacteriales bacterium]|nr:hypothetical protein [Ignavibacteriales bacterium]
PKKKFIEALNAEGINASEGYPFPLYRQPLFIEKNFWPHGCPGACPLYAKSLDYTKIFHPASEKICDIGFWLPNLVLHGTKRDVDSIAKAIKKIQENSAELLGDYK